MIISASRALKRAPTWHSSPTTLKSLYGQPLERIWIGPGLGWPERDFEVVGKLYHVGAHFEALDALIFMAPSVLPNIFFTSLDCPIQFQCIRDFAFTAGLFFQHFYGKFWRSIFGRAEFLFGKCPVFFKKGSFFSKNAQFFGQKCSLFSKCSPKSSVSGLCLNLVMLFFKPETLVYWVFPLRQEVLPSGSVFSPETTSEFFPQFFFGAEFFENVK